MLLKEQHQVLQSSRPEKIIIIEDQQEQSQDDSKYKFHFAVATIATILWFTTLMKLKGIEGFNV